MTKENLSSKWCSKFKVQNPNGTGPGVWRKRLLLSYHTGCKCSTKSIFCICLSLISNLYLRRFVLGLIMDTRWFLLLLLVIREIINFLWTFVMFYGMLYVCIWICAVIFFQLEKKFSTSYLPLWVAWFFKGHRHDWSQCLFTKFIWHEILLEFWQKVIQKCTNTFGKDWTINKAEITHKSIYL